jgi:tRNA nucleotidyltransferase/poly(A) polymerase
MKKHLSHPVFKIISEVCDKENLQAYVIGGFVRDIFLDRSCKDIDVVVIGDGIEVAKKVAEQIGNETHVSVFKNFGTAMLQFEDYQVEFVGSRKESYREHSRKPLVETGTLEDDQNRRDFTINALALNLSSKNFGELIDPFNGLNDLKNKIIRTPLNPDVTYSDDPLRMMRAIRFASQLGFTIEKDSFEAIKKNRERIKIISMERVSEELNKIILSPVPSVGFKLLFDSQLLQLIFPQMAALHGVKKVNGHAHKDNFYHTLKVLDNISTVTNDLWLRWAAVLHDIAKPLTQRYEPDHGWTFHGHEDKGSRMVPVIFKQLKLPLNEKMKYVQKLVLLHLRPIVLAQDVVTDSAIRRLLFDAGDDVDDLMKLCQADITSKNEIKVKRYSRNFEIVKQKLIEVEEKDSIRNWQPPITGEIIMKTFNLKPGKEVGILKNAIREAILEGEIRNDFDEAFNLMLQKAKAMGMNLKN